MQTEWQSVQTQIETSLPTSPPPMVHNKVFEVSDDKIMRFFFQTVRGNEL
jgi:hypothetical protein